jgi:NMD protein affecting ribosome stability and mRNA decay
MPAIMMTCIRCQRSVDDGFQRVTQGLCQGCAHTLTVVFQSCRKGHAADARLALELPVDR